MRSLILFAALLVSCILHAQAPVHHVTYSFRYDTSTAAPRLEVTVRFKGDASGKTLLQLPDAWASQKELYKAITKLEAVSPGLRIQKTHSASQRLLLHRAGAELVLRYILQQDWNQPFEYPMNYRAVLQKSWIQATGYSILAKPSWPKEDRVQATLDWKGMPKGWAIANSFHAMSRSYTGSCSVADLDNSLYIGGDFRLYRRQVRGNAVYTAIRGSGWSFTDTALVSKAVRIIDGERNFWKDHRERYFLLSVVPFEGTQGFNINGSALCHSFFMGMSRDSFAAANMQPLLAHEYMHRWIGGKLLLQGKEEEQYWFTEGFTEYYSFKIVERLGLITMPEFLSMLNKTLRDYYLLPVRHALQKAAGDSFWLARDYQRLPYVKGFAVALYFDALLQQQSGGQRSLDDILFSLSSAQSDGKPFPAEELLGRLRREVPATDSLFRSWIVEGNLVPVLPLPAAAAYTLRHDSLGIFELGFSDVGLKKGKALQGVIEGSAAWKAGVRNGQLLQSMNIHYGDMSQPVQLGVLDNGALRKISYYPIQSGRTLVPQYDVSGAR
jgi:predicted metalloprotease with PDZ domain